MAADIFTHTFIKDYEKYKLSVFSLYKQNFRITHILSSPPPHFLENIHTELMVNNTIVTDFQSRCKFLGKGK